MFDNRHPALPLELYQEVLVHIAHEQLRPFLYVNKNFRKETELLIFKRGYLQIRPHVSLLPRLYILRRIAQSNIGRGRLHSIHIGPLHGAQKYNVASLEEYWDALGAILRVVHRVENLFLDLSAYERDPRNPAYWARIASSSTGKRRPVDMTFRMKALGNAIMQECFGCGRCDDIQEIHLTAPFRVKLLGTQFQR